MIHILYLNDFSSEDNTINRKKTRWVLANQVFECCNTIDFDNVKVLLTES